MPPLPADLPEADCPLLTKYGGEEAAALVRRFNTAAAKLREYAADRHLSSLFASGRMDAEVGTLNDIRRRLARQRFVVGCIGVTQAGKSSTINSIVGQEVCKQGAMSATSSQPSRIIGSDTERLEVVYLSRTEYDSRRQELCEAINLPSPPPDAELLPKLDHPDELRRDEKGKPTRLPRLDDDLAYLRDFLRSHAKHPDLIQAMPRVDSSIAFDKRYEVTAHGGQVLGDRSMLLREARFFVRSENLPAELELCDLPGLGSKRSVDDVVTRSFLGELDGVFLFASLGENPEKEEMLKILQDLRQAFQARLTGRAWVIFTKMDTLTEEVYRDASQGNVFGTIQQFLDRVGMTHDQACFCSNQLWKEAGRGQLTRESAARQLRQTADVPVPVSCPELMRPAWEQLLKDGGITHVRGLMFQTVARKLAGQIRDDVAKDLERFQLDLEHRVAAEKRKLAGGAELFQKAMTCYGVVLQLRVGLTSRPAEFPILVQQGEHLKRRLSEFFDNPATAQVVSALTPAELAAQFRTHARVMNATLAAELSGDVVDQVYQFVAQRLEGLPPVDLGSAGSCHDTWQQFRAEDRGRDDWRTGVPGFDSPELADWLASADDGPGGDGYLGLMRDKIDAAVKQSVHALRTRLRGRLGEIEKDLSLLIADRETPAG